MSKEKIKPSERIKQLSEEFFNTYKFNRSPIEDILEYLDEQAEQEAKKPKACEHIFTGINQMQKESYCTKCGVKKQSTRR